MFLSFMAGKYLFPFLALMGACLGLLIALSSITHAPPPPILFPPPVPPYAHSIAGAGIIIASSQNIGIGSPFSQIVTDVFVIEGQNVQQGECLFQLDTRALEAQRQYALASLSAARILYEDKKMQFSFYERLQDKKAVSEQSYQQAYFAVKEAEQQVHVAKASLVEVETDIERSMIRAPITGQILQVNIHRGELAPTILPALFTGASTLLASQGSLMLMGSVNPLQMRVDIDEAEAWRFRSGAHAIAFVRGNSALKVSMEYVRTEPYIIPKSSFTGETIERIDTRVLQVLYTFEKGDLPLYPGQVLDVFIEASSDVLISSEN